MAVPDGSSAAGCPGAVRDLEHDLEELQSGGRIRGLGAGAGAGAAPGAADRGPRLSCLDRLHDRAGASARSDPAEVRGGLFPTTRKKYAEEPPDHPVGRSRGGLPTENHVFCDGRGGALAFILTPGQAADTSALAATLEQI